MAKNWAEAVILGLGLTFTPIVPRGAFGRFNESEKPGKGTAKIWPKMGLCLSFLLCGSGLCPHTTTLFVVLFVSFFVFTASIIFVVFLREVEEGAEGERERGKRSGKPWMSGGCLSASGRIGKYRIYVCVCGRVSLLRTG